MGYVVRSASLNAWRVRFKPWGSFALATGLLIWLLAIHLHQIAHPKHDGAHTVQPFGVMGTFWASGWAVRHGQDPFVEYPPLTWKPGAFGKDGPPVLDVNLNPPSMLPVFSLLSRIPLRTAANIWTVTSTLLLLGIAALLIRRYQPERQQVWWLLTCSATIMTLGLQQIYVALLALTLAAWLLLESDHDIASGILLGALAAIKPNMAVWPLFLALSGRRKLILPTCVTAAVLSVIPVFLYGTAVYPEWWRATGIDSHSIFPADISIAGNFTRLGSRPAGLIIALALFVLLVCLVRAGKPQLYETTGIALCASILCSPLGWLEYILFLAPILFAKRWTLLTGAAAWLLWINPAFVDPQPYASHWSAFFRGLIYFVPMCTLLVEYCRPALRALAARWQPDYNLSAVSDS
jgi:hypothetical protein